MEKSSVNFSDNVEQSRAIYQNNLDDYIESSGKFKKRADNPVYGVIEKLGNTNDNEKRQKWERAAALMGLNTLFSSVGGAVSAFAGVRPLQPSNEPFNYAMAQIDSADRNSRQDYNRYYKSQLAEAIRGERRSDAVADRYLDGLDRLHRDDVRENIYSSKLKSDFDRQRERDQAAMNRLEYSVNSKGGTRAVKSKSSDKPEMYVKNDNGRRVPLYSDDMTKLYQIGQIYEIDKPYKSASSENVRKREFDVLMQRAYLIYERDKDSLDKRVNSDIKSSKPFTLTTK